MNDVYAEISENGKRIEVFFSYEKELVDLVKRVSGSKFLDRQKGGPLWYMPLDFSVATELRKSFGEALVVGDHLKQWGWRERKRTEQLASFASADAADLKRLPKVLPELHKWLRGYQHSGAAFVAVSEATLVADQPGLGKTTEVIAGIFEAGAEKGSHLVIAPIVSLESVWQRELERWQPYPVFIAKGGKRKREEIIEEFREAMEDGPAWLVVNPQMVAMRRIAPTCDACGDQMKKVRGEHYQCCECQTYDVADKVPAFGTLGEILWRTVTIDECHRNAVRNPKTLTAQAMFKLQAEKRIAISGTPIANKPIDLWGILHFLRPDVFTSKWRWAGQWLDIEENQYGKVIGGIREDRREDFYRSLTPYVLRRTKNEVLKELPPKSIVDLWAEMTPGQAKQYKAWAKEAQLRIKSTTLTATEVLTEYLRCKQFAIAAQKLTKTGDKVTPIPTADSGKLFVLEELLEERGILEGEGDEKVVVFSQFEKVVDMVIDWLAEKGVEALKLSGRTKDKTAVEVAFQKEGGPRVVAMTTQTGGVSITLDRADSCVFMDETWVATDSEQAEDRLHRASRMHNVTCYYIRTKKTIDEYIMEVVFSKGTMAKEILDKRRDIRLY